MSEQKTPVAQIIPARVPPQDAKSGNPPQGPQKGQGTPKGGTPMDLSQLLGMPKPGLFDAMNAPLRDLTPDDIDYAGEVDAALMGKPRLTIRILSFLVFFLMIFLIVWAWIAELDEVTHAEGQVIASQKTQSIQNLEGGIIREMKVREGQTVEKGALLARLDNEMAEASYRDTISKIIESALAIIRLEAELKSQKPNFPKDMKQWLLDTLKKNFDEQTIGRANQLLLDQEDAYASHQQLLASDLEVLETQLKQREHDVDEQKERMKQLKKTLGISQSQLSAARELLSRQNFAKMEYLNLEKGVVEIQGQISALESSIPRAEAAVSEASKKIQSRKAEVRSQMTQELNKRRIEYNSLIENLSAGGDRVTRTELRSPVKGTIRQIYINTVGGVVKPGEPVMDIVPLDDTLLIEARVKPQDVAFLRPDQDVMVKVSAYDFSIYGGLKGKLESISADTVENKRGEFHYIVKVRTHDTVIKHNKEILPIIPGMMVTADIMTGKKSVLDYLMKPILKAKQNAMRER